MNFSDDLNAHTIRAGSTFRSERGSVIKIKQIIPHPNYDSTSINIDFALLELLETLNFTDKIQPIALSDADTVIEDDTLSLVTGWGKQNQFDLIFRVK